MATPNKGTYFPDPTDFRSFGIDISSNQGFINWELMANNAVFPRAEFIAARTGISWAYKDSWFETYWESIKEFMPDTDRYAYHVLYPAQPIAIQVANMSSRFYNNNFDGVGVVADVELKHETTREKMSASVYEFVNRLRDWSKKPVIIYSRYNFVLDNFDISSSKYLDWYADQFWWMAAYYGKNVLGYQILKEYPTEFMGIPDQLKFMKLVLHQTGDKGDGKAIGTTSAQVDTDRLVISRQEYNEIFHPEIIPPVEPPPVEPPPMSDIEDRLTNVEDKLNSAYSEIDQLQNEARLRGWNV